jgi:hypothetical protein
MTQKEKLKKLLEVAVENGCNNELVLYFFENINTIRFYDFTQSDFCLKFWVNDELFSLNDLITNWEEGEISFIEALCKTIYHCPAFKRLCDDEYDCGGKYLLQEADSYRIEWILKPTSQRLNFLFETFKHLIQ